jgi:hypothetical protein
MPYTSPQHIFILHMRTRKATTEVLRCQIIDDGPWDSPRSQVAMVHYAVGRISVKRWCAPIISR